MLNALQGLHIDMGTHSERKAFVHYLLGFHMYLEPFGSLHISVQELSVRVSVTGNLILQLPNPFLLGAVGYIDETTP